MTRELFTQVACAGINHHTAGIADIEAFRFEDEVLLLEEAREWFRGALILQTCNRIELMVDGDATTLAAFLEDRGRTGFWTLEGRSALKHMLELAAGMDSMVVGEDQILGQMKGALSLSQKAGVCSPIVDLCVTKAVHVGIEVRKRTNINKGAVSIGSAAVELAEECLGTLDGRHILVVGGGEMGMLVTQALAARDLTAIYVTNRTFERAVSLARKVGGKAVRMDDLYRYAPLADVIISCTAAPHPIIKKDAICTVMSERIWPLDTSPKPLIIVDIAQPRDVEAEVGGIEGVHLFTIDDLKVVSEKNMNNRKMEADEAISYLNAELEQFIALFNRPAANAVLAELHTWAEAIRVRERDHAVTRLKSGQTDPSEVLDDLSRVLAKKLLLDATYSVRSSAECGELEHAQTLVRAITKGEKVCFPKDAYDA